jgi:hypothetical protein
MALADVPLIQGISNVSLREVADDGSDSSWPDAIKATDLVMLDEDPVRVQFQVVEVIA